MAQRGMSVAGILLSAGLLAALFVPVVIAAMSPLLEWRQPAYIVAGLAGVVGLSLLLLQPLLIGGHVPGVGGSARSRFHRWSGIALVAAVIVHVAGLYVTSPPDVVDALLLRSPTPFSLWGVVSMWAIAATALLVAFRRRIGMQTVTWRLAHAGLALVIVMATAAHALLIEGTMGTVSKAILCALAVVATVKVVIDRRIHRLAFRQR